MQYKIEKPSSVEICVKVDLDAQDVNDLIKKSAEKTFLDATIDKIMVTEDFMPVSPLGLTQEVTDLVKDTPYTFTFTFQVLPHIDLPDLEQLEVTLPEPSLDTQALYQFQEFLRRKCGRLLAVEEKRYPQEGDICLANVSAFFEGQKIMGLTGTHVHFFITQGPKAAPVVPVLCGLYKGESGTGEMKVPEDYPEPHLRGKNVEIQATIEEIFIEDLPKTPEEIVEKLGMESVEELNKYIFSSVMSDQMKYNKNEAQNKLLDQLLTNAEFEIPSYLIATHEQDYFQEAANFFRSKGSEGDELSAILEGLREEGHQQASKQGKAQAFLMALAFREKLEISEKEVEDYFANLAQQVRQEVKVIKQHFFESGKINDLRERLLASKALELMYQKAKKVVVDKEGKVLEAPNFG